VWETNPVSKYLPFGIVFEMSVSLVSPFNQHAELCCKGFLIEEVVNPKTRPGSLSRVRGANTPPRGPNATDGAIQISSSHGDKKERSTPRSTKLDFLEPIHDLMEIEHELRSVRDEQPVRAIQTLGLQLVEFFEERREMYDDAVSDQTHAFRVYQTYGEVVKRI
jgi:hypothetical protein